MTKPNIYMHLRRFAEDVAKVIGRAVTRGEWIPFELVEQPAGSSVLYSYNSLVGDFIDSKWDEITSLESFKLASGTLTSCKSLEQYLSEFGPGAAKAGTAREGAALAVFTKRIWHDSSNMDLSDGRFETAYAELEEFGITSQESAGGADEDGVWLEQADVGALAVIMTQLDTVAPEVKQQFLRSASPILKLRLQRCIKEYVSDHEPRGFPEQGLNLVPEREAQVISDERLNGLASNMANVRQQSASAGADWIGEEPEEPSFPRRQPMASENREGSCGPLIQYDDIEDANDFSAPV